MLITIFLLSLNAFAQAIKYLERMLIQAQCQSEREKRCQITANDEEIKNADDSMVETVATATTAPPTPKIDTNGDTHDGDVEMLDLNATRDEATTITAAAAAATDDATPASGTINENGIVDAMSDKEIKIEDSDDDDPYAKDIAIEPRTYCKLGHFHLLLEDYPKGMFCYPSNQNFGTILRLNNYKHFHAIRSLISVPEIL